MSAKDVQVLASAALKDGSSHPELVELADVGAQGEHPGNAARDIARLTQRRTRLLLSERLGAIRIFVKKPPLAVFNVRQNILDPHELFSWLYHAHPEQFGRMMFGGDNANIRKFWGDMRDHPSFAEHPVCRRPELETHIVPIIMHGDGVPVSGLGKSWLKCVEIYSWGSMLGTGPTRLHNLLIFFLYTGTMCTVEGETSRDRFQRRVRWSLYWLSRGVFPRRDEFNNEWPPGRNQTLAGRALAGGYAAVLWGQRCDIEQGERALGHANHMSLSPCPLCEANSADKPWSDMNVDATWKETSPAFRSNTEWRNAHPDVAPLCDMPGASVVQYVPDWMHTKNIGTDQDYYGSVLKYLTHHMLLSDPDDNLVQVFEHIKAYYKACLVYTTLFFLLVYTTYLFSCVHKCICFWCTQLCFFLCVLKKHPIEHL